MYLVNIWRVGGAGQGPSNKYQVGQKSTEMRAWLSTLERLILGK
jgi:hypothetical protein